MRSLVRVALAFAAVSCAISPAAARAQTAPSSDTAKVRLIRQLITTARLTDQAMQVIEQAVPAQRVANPRVPVVFWDRFLEQVRARRGELEDGYVAIYDRNFTAAEVRGLIGFYESPIGKRFLELQPVLLREGMVMGQEWGSRIGADVGRTLSAEAVPPGP